jgi:hypothetical protein
MLQRIAADSVASPQSASTAMAALITVMAEQGRVEEAEGQYREWSGRMTGEEAQNLREKLSWAWILKGDFLTAKTIIADDSSIGTLAIRDGWRCSTAISSWRPSTSGPRGRTPGPGTRPPGAPRWPRWSSGSNPIRCRNSEKHSTA